MLCKPREIVKQTIKFADFKAGNAKELSSQGYYYLGIVKRGFRLLIAPDGFYTADGKKVSSPILTEKFSGMQDMAENLNVVFDGLVSNGQMVGEALKNVILSETPMWLDVKFYAYDMFSLTPATYCERVAELGKITMDNFIHITQQIYSKPTIIDRLERLFTAGMDAVLIQDVYGKYESMTTGIVILP